MITSNFLKIMLLVMAFSVVACKKGNRRAEAEKAVNEWIGREIKFPEDIQCCVLGKDTTRALCDELFSRDFKVLLYVDSMGCSACRLKLSKWKQYISEIDSIFPKDKVSFLFFIQPNNSKTIASILRKDLFNYPIFVDSTGMINRLNRLPEKDEYQCFLLDSKNTILLIGNPVIYIKLWELYKKEIIGNLNKNAK
jgi:hypothetical protein